MRVHKHVEIFYIKGNFYKLDNFNQKNNLPIVIHYKYILNAITAQMFCYEMTSCPLFIIAHDEY